MADLTTRESLLARLRALLPLLEYGRETHRQWRDCSQKDRDDNPAVGDREFHAGMFAEYDERIACVKDSITYIEADHV